MSKININQRTANTERQHENKDCKMPYTCKKRICDEGEAVGRNREREKARTCIFTKGYDRIKQDLKMCLCKGSSYNDGGNGKGGNSGGAGNNGDIH